MFLQYTYYKLAFSLCYGWMDGLERGEIEWNLMERGKMEQVFHSMYFC